MQSNLYCPVCKKGYRGASITLHVVNAAKHERAKRMKRWLDAIEGEQKRVMAIDFKEAMKAMPHEKYIRGHIKTKRFFRMENDKYIKQGVAKR